MCTGRASYPASSPSSLVAWLIINGFAYLAMSFTGLLLPQSQDMVSNIAFPALLGEMAFMLWLLVKGVNVPKWEERVHGLAGGDNYLGVLRINEPRSGGR